jgi:hypothetical protein
VPVSNGLINGHAVEYFSASIAIDYLVKNSLSSQESIPQEHFTLNIVATKYS